MKPDERAYYVRHGKVLDPGGRATLLSARPSDPERLVTAVSTLILHRLFVAPFGITPHPESAGDVESRTVPRILDRILARDAAPLDIPRPPERRFIGICRDYTLLACAVLRQHGVPARARVGFANYFTPNFTKTTGSANMTVATGGDYSTPSSASASAYWTKTPDDLGRRTYRA